MQNHIIREYILYRYYPNKSHVDGFFDEDDGNIYISKKLGKIAREIVFAHESQHRDCYNNKCKCWGRGTDYWCEYHAFRAEFRFVLRKNSKRYWKAYFEGVIRDLTKFKDTSIRSWGAHFQALCKVCRFKAFQEAARRYGFQKSIEGLCS